MNELATKLMTAHEASRRTLAGVALSAAGNRAGTWRVQDVLTHIASWEREVTASLLAALADDEHTLSLPFDLDELNERFRAEHADLAPDSAVAMWEDVRRQFAEAVNAADENLSFRCPWGKVDSIDRVVAEMIEHEETHMRFIHSTSKDPR